MYVLCRGHRYKVVKRVADGAQGSVSQVHDRHTGQLCALKIFRNLTRPKMREAFRVEVEALQRLKDVPGVLHLYDTWRTYNEGFVVTELCNGSLDPPTFGTLTLEDLRGVAQFLVRTLRSVHERGVQHNDVKPANVLRIGTRDQPECYRLCDFGMATFDGQCPTYCGTLDYLAPECFFTADTKPLFGQADVWSMGVTLYELCTGAVPFYDESHSRTQHNICEASPRMEAVTQCDHQLSDFIQATLVKDPNQRARLDRLACHPFLVPPATVPTPT